MQRAKEGGRALWRLVRRLPEGLSPRDHAEGVAIAVEDGSGTRFALSVERDILVVACAASAGIHAALVREHFAEGTGAGLGFLVAAVLLGGLVGLLTYRPSAIAFAAAGLVLVGLLGSYALAITTGVPVLHPEQEPVEGLAVVTKAIEIVGLAAALRSLRTDVPVLTRTVIERKGIQL